MLSAERPAAGHRLDLLTFLDQLQDLVEGSPRLPFSDRAIVSSDALLDLLDAIRNTLPHDVIEAERVLLERHRLLEDAREEAEQMLESARQQSKFMLQDHHLIKAAELKADRIRNQAQREADEVMQSADQYVEDLFRRLEDEALRLAAEIRKVAVRGG